MPCTALLGIAGDNVKRVVFRVSHVVMDRWGRDLLQRELAKLFEQPAEARLLPPAPAPSPLDLAAYENSDRGRALQDRSLEFFKSLYRSAPATMFPQPLSDGETPRFWFGEYRSAPLRRALNTIRDTHGIDRLGVIAGTLASVVADTASVSSALIFTISNNRFDAAWDNYAGSMAQEAVLLLPIRDSLIATMRDAATLSLRSLQRARYCSRQLADERARVEEERGVEFDKVGRALVLNLMSGTSGDLPVDDTASGAPTFTWTGKTDAENLALYLDAYDDDDVFVLRVRLDTRRHSPAFAQHLLETMGWAIVAAADADLPQDAVSRQLSRGWVRA